MEDHNESESISSEMPSVETQAPAQVDEVAQSVTASIFTSSRNIAQIFMALAKAQSQPGYGVGIEPSLVAQVTKGGATFNYAPLSAVLANVRPLLSAEGIALIQLPLVKRVGNATAIQIRTMLGHKSGEWLANDLVLSINSTSPRDVGTGITYGRRYSLCAITGTAPDQDMDDNEGEGVPSAPKPAQRISERAGVTGLANIGSVVSVEENAGGASITLNSGFKCGTNRPELIGAAKKALASKKRVELSTRPSANPIKFLPVLEEIVAHVD